MSNLHQIIESISDAEIEISKENVATLEASTLGYIPLQMIAYDEMN